jgi:radical SAM PhpK family P-methyltransferase
MAALDCIVIGYNEPAFEGYESTLRAYGKSSETYRDLRFSFVNIGEKKLTYVDLLNYVFDLALKEKQASQRQEIFKSCDIPNLAAVYLTNFLRKRGLAAKYINLFQYEKEQLIQYLREDPLCIAITTTFYVWDLPVTEMITFIRHYNPKIRIIVGGPLIANYHRSFQGEDLATVLGNIGADIYVIESQGEATLLKIIECLKDKRSLEEVPNLLYFADGKSYKTKTHPEDNSLDENSIDWHLFADDNVGATVQTRTARSCAFKCAFCAYPLRAGKLQLASLKTFEQELDSIRDLARVKNVVFIDDTFNVPLERFKQMCRLMIDKQYNYNWFSYFRCSNSDEEAIQLMAESGCKGVFLGIESGSPRILKNMNKAATIEKYRDGIKLLKQHGILTFGSFIIGFPGETSETVAETVDFIKETRLDYYRALLWYCEPGTPIYNSREKYNILGDAFRWKHDTMTSMEAMGHIERLFLDIDTSLWLPQWSFDFWIIPYFLGRSISFKQFMDFMTFANKLLRIEISDIKDGEREILQCEYIKQMVQMVKNRERTIPVL